jgi:hypothetical protein
MDQTNTKPSPVEKQKCTHNTEGLKPNQPCPICGQIATPEEWKGNANPRQKMS